VRVPLLPDLDQVAVGAGHEDRAKFDDGDVCAERRIDAGHFQADDATTDDQHALRDLA